MKECRCKRDLDGQCAACRSGISESMKGFVLALRTFVEGVDRLKTDLDESVEVLRRDSNDLCNRCARQYLDLGISKMLDFLDGSKQSVAEAVYSSILNNMSRRIRKRPLTEKAWAELCRKNGWSRRR